MTSVDSLAGPAMQALLRHAYQRARASPGQRPEPGAVTQELRVLAGGDPELVHRAWDHCVQRYAEQEELAWLRAATYLLPLELELQHEDVQARRRRTDARSRRAASGAETTHAHRRDDAATTKPPVQGPPAG